MTNNTPQTSVREKVRKIIEKAVDIKDYDDSDADKILSLFDQELEGLEKEMAKKSDLPGQYVPHIKVIDLGRINDILSTLRNNLKK